MESPPVDRRDEFSLAKPEQNDCLSDVTDAQRFVVVIEDQNLVRIETREPMLIAKWCAEDLLPPSRVRGLSSDIS